jgi:hypothetical protein
VRCFILAGCWFLSLGPCICCTNKISRNMAQSSLAAERARRISRLLSSPLDIIKLCCSCFRQQASRLDWPNQTLAVGPSRAVSLADIGTTLFRRIPSGDDGPDGYPTLPNTMIHAGSNPSCNPRTRHVSQVAGLGDNVPGHPNQHASISQSAPSPVYPTSGRCMTSHF